MTEEKKKDRHPVCAPFLDLFDQINNDKELAAVFEERSKLDREAKDLQRKIGDLKGAYDTSLLRPSPGRRKAGQCRSDQKGPAGEDKHPEHSARPDRCPGAKDQREWKVMLLWERLQGLQQTDRERLRADLRSMYFWYPIKRLGMQMLFLLPLFAIFYAWNDASIRKGRGIQALISTHLMVVSFIPIFSRSSRPSTISFKEAAEEAHRSPGVA